MQCCPDARQQEFAQAVDAARLTSGMVVADVPAGGGYLQRYLPSGCHWLGHEPCASFTNHGTLTGDARPLLPLPWSDASAVDPEEAFVAALASCHMLWFLSIAAQRGFCVDRYEDAAEGVMARNAERRMAMTVVTLRPAVWFSGERLPNAGDIAAMHHEAHEECFIANSVKTDVRCEPRVVAG